jgi:metal-dependent amidase/aminoacylase/carboxypeptidase family protein
VVPGYAPFKADLKMHSRLRTAVEELGIPFIEEDYSAASSDMGDVSQIIPSIMLGLPGVNGLFHNPGFRVTDEQAAFILPSVVLARYLEKLV